VEWHKGTSRTDSLGTLSLSFISHFIFTIHPSIQQAVSRKPGILLSRGVGYDAANEGEVQAIEEYLEASLGLTPSMIARFKAKAPWLFQRTVKKLEVIVDYLQEMLTPTTKTMPSREKDKKTITVIRDLLLKYPTVLNLSVKYNLKPRIAFLQEECGLTRSDIFKVCTMAGFVLTLSVTDNLQPTIQLLSDILDPADDNEGAFDDDEDEEDAVTNRQKKIRTCILSHPQILGLSLGNLKSKLTYFEAIDRLSEDPTIVDDDSDADENRAKKPAKRTSSLASKIALRAPAVFSLSLKHNIVPTIEFLSRVWGTTTPPVRWTGINNPGIVILEKEDTIPEETSSTLTGPSLAYLLGEYPGILTLSLEGNIQPTMKFYNRTGYVPLDDNWNLCQQQYSNASSGLSGLSLTNETQIIRGRYIASSLFQRLLPRWHYYLMNKLRVDSDNEAMPESPSSGNGETETKKTDKSKGLPLHILSLSSDQIYCDHLGADVDQFHQFKEQSIPNLKFSSQFDTWLKTGRPIDV